MDFQRFGRLRAAVAALCSAAILSTSLATPAVAQSINGGNLKPTPGIESLGGVNTACAGGSCDVVVASNAQDVPVSFQIQLRPLMKSSDASQTSDTYAIYVPHMLQNPTFTLVSATIPPYEAWDISNIGPSSTIQYGQPMTQEAWNGEPAKVFLPPQGGSFAPQITKLTPSDAEWTNYNPSPGDASYNDYDVYLFSTPSGGDGVSNTSLLNVRLDGTVTPGKDTNGVTNADTFVPVRAINVVSRELLGVGENLISTLPFAQTGQLPTASLDLSDADLNTYKANNTIDGLGGFGSCSPTKNGAADQILDDVTPGIDRVEAIIKTFNLMLNTLVNFALPGLQLNFDPNTIDSSDPNWSKARAFSQEDGCDQSAFHIRIAPETTTSTPTPTAEIFPSVPTVTVTETVTVVPTPTPAPTSTPTASPSVVISPAVPTAEPTVTATKTVTVVPIATPTPSAAISPATPTPTATSTPAPVAGSSSSIDPLVIAGVGLAGGVLGAAIAAGSAGQSSSEAVHSAQPLVALATSEFSTPVQAAPTPTPAVLPTSKPKKAVLANTGVAGFTGIALAGLIALIVGLALVSRRKES